MRRWRIALAAVVTTAIAASACDLNPQPLPPDGPEGTDTPTPGAGFGGSKQEDGTGAAPPEATADGGLARSDAGIIDGDDAGDGGDAAEDAGSDGG